MTFSILCNTVIRDHFTRKRALACGISYAGETLSGLVFPPLVQFLLEKYGQKGMFLVTGALMLNSTAGALLHLLPPETARKPASILEDGKKREMSFDKACSHKSGLRDSTDDSTGRALSPEDDGFLTQDDVSDKRKTIQGVRDHLNLPQAMLSESQTTEDPHNKKQKECSNKTCVSSYKEHDDVLDVHNETAAYGLKTSINRNKITSPSHLRCPQFYIVAVAFSVIAFNVSTYSTVVVDFATDRKIYKWNAVLLLTIYAISDLLSRMGSGFITDKGFLKKSSMMAGNFLLWALSLCAMPFCYSFYLHAIQAVIVGLCSGATLILIPVFLMELVNTNKFSECFGLATLIAGIALLPRPLLIGYFRDSLGDYQGLFVLMGVVTALSAFSCLFLRGTH
ncbi:monocarboxylate transporter 9-like [Ixodes scapularis]|uniref:monocarboxylate transporter 9-like n=1 Tax=Ixodes scapularis TaxID=6945 RepID=UPI001A9F066B|nr:monocarboxylate transporter 9-like [Ixodes scapularis]